MPFISPLGQGFGLKGQVCGEKSEKVRKVYEGRGRNEMAMNTANYVILTAHCTQLTAHYTLLTAHYTTLTAYYKQYNTYRKLYKTLHDCALNTEHGTLLTI